MKITRPKINKKVSRTLWALVFLFDIVGVYIMFHPDLLVMPFVNAAQTQQQSPQQPTKSKVVSAPTVSAEPTSQPQQTANTDTPAVVTVKPAISKPVVQSAAPAIATPAPDCSPNATSQDPCKLGQCFGYPYGVCESNPNQSHTQKDQTPPDPNRPSYDLWGNEWTATGTLIHATCPNVKDPISGKDNPECVCPQFIRGYDQNTNAAICGYVTGCPYGDSVPLGAECYKNCLNENPQAATDPAVCYQGTGYTQ
jgi:hypothetical protein